MSYRLQETLFSLTLLLLGIGLFIHSYDAQYAEMGGEVNSMFYARFLFLVWIVSSAIISCQALRQPVKEEKQYSWRQIFIACACLGLFLVLFTYIGFTLASTIFFCLYAMFLGARPFYKVALLAVIYSVAINYLFTAILQISLPTLGG